MVMRAGSFRRMQASAGKLHAHMDVELLERSDGLQMALRGLQQGGCGYNAHKPQLDWACRRCR